MKTEFESAMLSSLQSNSARARKRIAIRDAKQIDASERRVPNHSMTFIIASLCASSLQAPLNQHLSEELQSRATNISKTSFASANSPFTTTQSQVNNSKGTTEYDELYTANLLNRPHRLLSASALALSRAASLDKTARKSGEKCSVRTG